jgi:hypothetical protein
MEKGADYSPEHLTNTTSVFIFGYHSFQISAVPFFQADQFTDPTQFPRRR